MNEEVKINVRAESDTEALDRTKRKITELRGEAEKERQHAEKFAANAGFDDITPRKARARAAALDREANRLERPFIAEDKAGQKAAARDAGEEKKKFAAEDRAVQQAVRTAEKTAAAEDRSKKKTEHTEAKAAARELHAEETQRQRFGRIGMNLGMQAAQGGSLSGGIGSLAAAMGPAGMAGIAAVAAVAVGKIADEVWTDITERKGIALRDQAARRMNTYDRGVMAGVRGTSGQSRSDEVALERQMEERAANRAELERKGERNPWNPLRWFGSKQTFASQRELADNDVAQKRDAGELEKKQQQTRDKFENEEGGLGLDALRQRAKRSMSGQREAFMDDYLAKALGTKRAYEAKGATPEQQNEAAKLEMTNSLRDRQISAGSGLVDARSGAGDIAAAANWARQSTPGEGELVKRFDVMIGKMDEQTAHSKHQPQDVR